MLQAIVLSIVLAVAAGETCQQYLTGLAIDFQANKTAAQKEVAKYVLLSGKVVDDLGFPDMCTNISANYMTVEFTQPQPTFNETVYYGLCFNSLCTAQDFNDNKQQAIAIINDLDRVHIPDNVELTFVQPRLNLQVSSLAIAMLIVFAVVLLVNLAYSFKRWWGLCTSEFHPANDSAEGRYTFEDSEPHYDAEESTMLRRMSFEYKFQTYLCDRPEPNDKVVSFSVFKLFCVPMVIYGQEFYFRNFGAFNYYAFNEEIYSTLFSKVAMFSVYLPDVLFFISGYLLAKKCLQLEVLEGQQVAQFLGRKLYRLYPFYIATILIYATISSSMHAGPVWYVYEGQVDLCKKYWWRSLLLIGNWWSQQCYAGGWFVEAEVQLILVCLAFFAVYQRWKRVGLVIYAILVVAMLVLTFVLSPNMPISLEHTLDKRFFQSFTSTYNYLLFYLLGLGMAILKSNRALNEKLVEFFDKSIKAEIVLTVLALGLGVLVLMRPSVWASASGVEFTLCRIAVFLCFLFLFLTGMFRPDDAESTSRVHQVAHYSYHVMLFAPIVTLSSVWGASSFSYVSAMNQLNLLITEFIISVVVGVCMGMLVEYRFAKR